jgi:hypothetical protein
LLLGSVLSTVILSLVIVGRGFFWLTGGILFVVRFGAVIFNFWLSLILDLHRLGTVLFVVWLSCFVAWIGCVRSG